MLSNTFVAVVRIRFSWGRKGRKKENYCGSQSQRNPSAGFL